MYVYAKITDNRLTLEAHPDLSTLGDNTRDRLAHITTVSGSASARLASESLPRDSHGCAYSARQRRARAEQLQDEVGRVAPACDGRGGAAPRSASTPAAS